MLNVEDQIRRTGIQASPVEIDAASLEEQVRQTQLEAIGQMAGTVAHDFDGYLKVIRTATELLLISDRSIAGQSRQLLTEVVSAAERAAGLTRQLLAFGQRQALQLRPLNLNEAVGNLASKISRILGERIQLQCRYTPIPAVEADPILLEQVLLTLVQYARDAMPKGGELVLSTTCVQVEEFQVFVHPERRAGEYVALSVQDTGKGIAPENLGRVFEPFSDSSPNGKSLSLGLAAAYGIVRQHQGWLEVSSQVGKGTVFKILLPVQRDSIPDALRPQSWAPELPQIRDESMPVVRGGAETVLLLDDDEPVRILSRRILEDLGYQVLTADSVRAACDIWRSRGSQIQLLLVATTMTDGTSGRELAQQFRAQHSNLKVILTSGYNADAISEHTAFFQRSRSPLLLKPYSPRALAQMVRQCLDHA